MSDPTAVFAYGTLKRGECRERYWPVAAAAVTEAASQGTLYDLGPYPGLLPGTDVIVGELREFSAEEMPLVLRALDEVEGFCGGEDDLYRREIVRCVTGDGRQVFAWAYFYARKIDASSHRQIAPGPDGRCRWS